MLNMLVSPIHAELDANETLLWSGQPKQGFVFRAADVFLIPFSFLWASFAFFWEYQVITGGAPFFFLLWGIPFMLVGLYITVGRFFVDMRVRSRTFYAATSQRVIILSGVLSRTVNSLDLQRLSDISIEQKDGGIGTISFGSSMPFASWYRGLHWPGMSQRLAPEFELIPDAKQVYEIIRQAQRSLK